MEKLFFTAVLLAGSTFAHAQNPPTFANQSQPVPVKVNQVQERHFLRAPDILPGTLPEMREAAYWVARMKEPDAVVMTGGRIEQMNRNFVKKVKDLTLIDSSARKLILDKIDAYPGLFSSEPDVATLAPVQLAEMTRRMIAAQVKYMRHTEFGNILGIQYAPKEIDKLEEEMSAGTVSNEVTVQPGITVEAVCLRIVPMISPEYIGQPDKNRTRWDVWNLDIVPIGSPVQILHESKSGGFLFVLSHNGYGWVPSEKVAMASRSVIDQFAANPHFAICTGDKVPYYSGSACKYASGWFRMGDRLPLAGASQSSNAAASVSHSVKGSPRAILVPMRQADGKLAVQQAWLAPDADVHIGYLPYTRRNVVQQSLKLLDNIYDWTGAWMGRNHATALRDIFACFGFRLPSCGELLSVFNDNTKILYTREGRQRQYEAVTANEPFITLQICSSGHSQLYMGDYNGVPIVYDTHGYNYVDSTGQTLDIRRSCIGTIALPDYFLKQNVVFVELK
jgi:hypothetical protein